MKNYNSEVILYAKGWYVRTNLIDDLKKVCGKRNRIDPEYMQVNDIIQTLFCIIEDHKNPIDMRFFTDFISDISPNSFKRNLYRCKTEYDFNEAVIEKCLSVISLMKVVDDDGTVLIKIDDVDSFDSVLPQIAKN